MNISPKRLTKFILTILFLTFVSFSFVLFILEPRLADKIFQGIMFGIFFITLVLGRKSIVEFFRRDEFRTPVKN